MSRVAGPPYRRARARVQMLEQIKRAALAQLAAGGAPACPCGRSPANSAWCPPACTAISAAATSC